MGVAVPALPGTLGTSNGSCLFEKIKINGSPLSINRRLPGLGVMAANPRLPRDYNLASAYGSEHVWQASFTGWGYHFIAPGVHPEAVTGMFASEIPNWELGAYEYNRRQQ